MRAALLKVRADAVEEVLDHLLPRAPRGVHERPREDGVVELICCEPPDAQTLLRAAGSAFLALRETTAPDDDLARRAWLYEPRVVAGRLHVRPEWAPAIADDTIIDIALEGTGAFGTGAHPTTRMCLEALAARTPGPLADLGCGTGVLAVAAALLGYAPVLACDVSDESVAAARATAARNGAAVTVTQVDLLAGAAPGAQTTLANVPPIVHAALAARLPAELRTLYASGVHGGEQADTAAAAYVAAGLVETARRHAGGWALVTLERP